MADHATDAAEKITESTTQGLEQHFGAKTRISPEMKAVLTRHYKKYIQQAIDAALAEQAAGVQGLVDAAEIALADYKAAYIVGETVTQKTVDRTGRIEILKDALSTFRAGKPTLPAEVVKILREVEWTNYGHRQGEPFCPWCRMARSCGHAGDCEYAALLAPYRKEQEDVQPN